uniref:Platelet endothelial cell adhesion molecule n=1 Tax=Tetraodon nigroviridis TaxID=99883 RepID=H3C120_TETNG
VILCSGLSLMLVLHKQDTETAFIIDRVGLTIQPSTTVQSGTPVKIICQVNISYSNTWNFTHTFQIRQNDAPVYSSTTKEDTVVYELNPARRADSGNYECRVTVKEISKLSNTQKLIITGLQTPILYVNNTAPYENEEFTAVCSAPEEKGSLIFHFYQRFTNGESQPIKQLAPSVNSAETMLVLSPLGDRLLSCDYEINRISGRSNRSNEISVLVKGLQIVPIMNVLPSSEVYEGDTMKVVCKVVNMQQHHVMIYLTMGRRILKQAPNSLQHTFTASVEHSGKLACKAVWRNVQKETSQTIRVKELFSKPKLTVEPTDLFFGDTFQFSCSIVMINKDTIKYSYYKDNMIVASSRTYNSTTQLSQIGNYTCEVLALSQNHSFVKKSELFVLNPKAVRVAEAVMSVVGGTLVLGKHFQVLCHSDNGSLPITYTLSSPSSPAKIREVKNPGEQAIFNVSALYKASDIRKLYCSAQNSKHIPVKTHTLHYTNIIEPVSKPVLKILPNMGDVTEGQDVMLVCSVQKGTTPIVFSWHHTNEGGPLTFLTSDKLEASFNITNVRAKHQRAYYCVSTNRAHETKQSQEVSIRVKTAGWKKGLIAASCILTLIVLILV